MAFFYSFLFFCLVLVAVWCPGGRRGGYCTLVVERLLRRRERAWWAEFLETLVSCGFCESSPEFGGRVQFVSDGLAHSSQLAFFRTSTPLQTLHFTAFQGHTKKFLISAAQNFFSASAHGLSWLSGGSGSRPRTSAYFGRAGFEEKYAFAVQDCCFVGSILPSLVQYPAVTVESRKDRAVTEGAPRGEKEPSGVLCGPSEQNPKWGCATTR